MKNPTICFFGDSITAGTGDEDYLGWPGRLCQKAAQAGNSVRKYNLGVSGDVSTGVAARWRAEATPRVMNPQAAGMVFSFGTNDTGESKDEGYRVPEDKWLSTAEAVISEAKDWVQVLWIGPVPVVEDMLPFSPRPGMAVFYENTRTKGLSDAYGELAAKLGVPYLDVLTPLSQDERWAAAQRQRDGVHPSGAGYQVLADLIAAWPAWKAWLE